jgi:hypothetical protein
MHKTGPSTLRYVIYSYHTSIALILDDSIALSSQTAALILNSLHKCIESIRDDPDAPIPEDIKKLRQANFKVEYKRRALPGAGELRRKLSKPSSRPRGRPVLKKNTRGRETPPDSEDDWSTEGEDMGEDEEKDKAEDRAEDIGEDQEKDKAEDRQG